MAAVEEGKYEYDYCVIGGGSGGLASAKAASDLGAKVVLFDYVKPSPAGTRWGIGGTCVNVGCIPKKLMHYSGILGAGMHDAKALGWELDGKPKHNWENMIEAVGNYIKSLNFGYRTELMTKGVDYKNALAHFADAHTVVYKDDDGKEGKLTAKNILVAVGGRPKYPALEGIEHVISSDDIFWQEKPPGKTLCIGASYISLECAGFLNEMGYDTTVMVRSILLRGFDRESAERIGKYMEHTGVKFIKEHVPEKFEKLDNGKIRVYYKASKGLLTELKSEDFDTVLMAVGRNPDTKKLNCDAAGLKTNKWGKFEVVNEQTNVPNIYAVGDVVEGADELTPVAIQAGMLLAKRLYGGSKLQMDYINVPTTVFTPLEYSCCGYSEEDAEKKFGADDIEVYHTQFTPLEQAATHRVSELTGDDMENPAAAKLICLKSDAERIVGIHYLGPNAGEIMQGFGLAIKLGATKSDFDNIVGIHPTTAEQFTTLKITKSSGINADAGGC